MQSCTYKNISRDECRYIKNEGRGSTDQTASARDATAQNFFITKSKNVICLNSL